MTIETLFSNARSFSTWHPRRIDDETLRQLHDIAKFGPTSANCSPARYVFVQSEEAKGRLKPCLGGSNVAAAMAAPVNLIIGMDMEFYEQLPRLFPQADARSWFAGNERVVKDTAFRNSTLQGAYLIIAARLLGLDAGPISGFDNAKVDEVFFKDTTVKSNFIVNLGYGDPSGLSPRTPRFAFDDIARIL